ncbi:tripartite tricarboxylate transporter TctB family protein [Chloroflexota bacterium]
MRGRAELDRRHDMVMALVLLLIGAWYFWAAAGNTGPVLKSETLHAAFIPRILATVMMASGLALIIDRLRKWRREKGNTVESFAEADEPGYPVFTMRPVVLAGLLILSAVGWKYLGFIAANCTVMFLGFVLLGRRDWKIISTVSVVFSLFLYLLFAVGMGVGTIPLLPLWMG